MKLEINERGNGAKPIFEAKVSGEVILSEVYSGFGIRTTEGVVYSVCLRDSGLEIICPDGALVGVKRKNYDSEPQGNETFIERDGRVVSE